MLRALLGLDNPQRKREAENPEGSEKPLELCPRSTTSGIHSHFTQHRAALFVARSTIQQQLWNVRITADDSLCAAPGTVGAFPGRGQRILCRGGICAGYCPRYPH